MDSNKHVKSNKEIQNPGSSLKNLADNIDLNDIPNIIFFANIDERVFTDESLKIKFETLIKKYAPESEFIYLPSFRRVRVQCGTSVSAANVRVHLNQTDFCGKPIKCYFGQVIEKKGENNSHLAPPPLEKQWLISPPSSPPVGWEPHPEATPVINYDLLAVIANLQPGCEHELHPATSQHPAIVVRICEDSPSKPPPKIPQTRCPERKQ